MSKFIRTAVAGAVLTLIMTIISFAAETTPAATTSATPPSAAKVDVKVTVTFAVSQKTDVEVAILGADGRLVRHLAAGVLGATNAPPAPLKAGLVQSIEWDGKDDYGVEVPGFRVQGSGKTVSSGYRLTLLKREKCDEVGSSVQ